MSGQNYPITFLGGVAGLVGSAEFTQICTTGVLSQLLLPKEDTDKKAALVQHDPCRDKITPLLFSWCRRAGELGWECSLPPIGATAPLGSSLRMDTQGIEPRLLTMSL